MSLAYLGMDAAEIKEHAAGYWPDIIAALAPQAIEAIEQCGSHVPCPVHGGKDGFRLFDDFAETGGGICNTCGVYHDGLGLLGWLNDWSFVETLNALRYYLCDGSLMSSNYSKPVVTESLVITDTEKRRRKLRIQRLWDSSDRLLTDKGNPAIQYLFKRGLGEILNDLPKDLGYRPRITYVEDNVRMPLPAMVAAVRDIRGNLVNVHKTHLTSIGEKAPVAQVKKLMPSPRKGLLAGCAVQLYEPDEVLCVAEGIETALAVRLGTDLPVWATLTASNMAALEIPDSVKVLRIYSDNDEHLTGQMAAAKLAQRMVTKSVKVYTLQPSVVGEDFLDMYNRGEHK